MSAQPPSYDSAMGPSSSHAHESRAQHLAHEDDGYSSSDDETSFASKRRQPTQEEIDERMSIDDEERELPEGWVRAFDKESGHQFYVDTRANPPRSIWVHPYDDPTYLKSIPDTHPAHPESTQAKEARSKYDQMMDQARRQREAKVKERSTGERIKDKLLGSTKQERDAKRTEKAARRARAEEEERKARQKYLERRAALMKQQGLSGRDAMLYGGNPYAYSRPAYPYGRGGMYGGGMYGGGMYGGYPRYGYGNGIGMGGGYGYGRMGGIGMGAPLLGLGTGMLLGGALF